MNKLLFKASALWLCLLGFMALFFSACATSNVNIPNDLSPAEIIQKAQEASDRNRYNVALQYYQALYERNLSNIDLVITAEYEIAFIHYKQKKYTQAREELNSMLEYYNSPDEAFLPTQYKILGQIVLNRIDEKETALFSKKKAKKT
jgi:outer membrane protein assembly factor BamD (BamD/ComL family)